MAQVKKGLGENYLLKIVVINGLNQGDDFPPVNIALHIGNNQFHAMPPTLTPGMYRSTIDYIDYIHHSHQNSFLYEI